MDVGHEKVDSSDAVEGGRAEIHRHAPALSNDFGLIGSGRRVDGSKPDDFLARLTGSRPTLKPASR